MTRNDIIRMAREAGSIDSEDVIQTVYAAFAAAELRRLHAELEREQMRLAACGVVALADTPDSAKHARQMHHDYESASCQDVARRVDECISLRAQRDQLLKALRDLVDAMTGRLDGETIAVHNALIVLAKAEAV